MPVSNVVSGLTVAELETAPFKVRAAVARRNHELVGAAVGVVDRDAFTRAVLVETGKNLTELAKIWGAPPVRALALIRSVHGREHFDAARAQARGVIVAAPHLGCWELLNLWLCAQGPMALLYRVPQHAEWQARRDAGACRCCGRARTAAFPEARDDAWHPAGPACKRRGRGIRTFFWTALQEHDPAIAPRRKNWRVSGLRFRRATAGWPWLRSTFPACRWRNCQCRSRCGSRPSRSASRIAEAVRPTSAAASS